MQTNPAVEQNKNIKWSVESVRYYVRTNQLRCRPVRAVTTVILTARGHFVLLQL